MRHGDTGWRYGIAGRIPRPCGRLILDILDFGAVAPTLLGMWQPSKPLVYGVGTLFVAHYLGAGFGNLRGADDLLQPPPLAAVVLTPASTGTVSTINYALTVVDPVTDETHTVATPSGTLAPYRGGGRAA